MRWTKTGTAAMAIAVAASAFMGRANGQRRPSVSDALRKDAGVRYFSGTATYRTTVNLAGSQLAERNSLWLDLGEVHEVAAVRINGKPAAILWKVPYSLRADSLLNAGDNTIEIDVTNLWPNRLIGDAQSPGGKHYTWTNIRKYTRDSPLLPSGLLGPVVLHTVYRLPLLP